MLAVCIGFNVSARTWYVNENNAATLKNGHYWLAALQSLTQALDSAIVGDTICVAAGNYVPGNSTNSTFALKNQVIVLGGYSSTDTTAARNFRTNKTILSGQLATGGNVLHVVTALACNGQTVLDGFVIQDGMAYGGGVPPETDMGGGILLSSTSDLQILNCVFQNNSGAKGSAVAIEQNSNAHFFNCYFLNNLAFVSGTVSIEDATASHFINCVFANNFARLSGAILFASHSGVSLINCTAFRNRVVQGADLPPGCVSAQNGSSLTISNSIFFANSTDVASNFNIDKMDFQSPEITVTGSTISVSNSIMQNYTLGSNLIIAENPRFRDTSNIAGPDDLFFTSDDGLQLMLPCSPALNSGSNASLSGITTDITGSNRIFDGNADMGAYEAQSLPGTPMKVVYVNAQANGTNNGSSWANAFTSLQQALLYCADTIKVAAGTYFPSSNNNTSSFWLRNRLIILGGYPSTGNPGDQQRDPSANITRLSGAIPDANGAKSQLVVFANRVDSTCTLDGLFISDAHSAWQDIGKSGIRITNQSNPKFNNCVIENNQGGNGGGLQVDLQSSPFFTNCRFKNNIADNCGAFFIRNGGHTTFKNCQFITNSTPKTNVSPYRGGAGSITNANVHFDSCTFTKNFSNDEGGALYMYDSAITVFHDCRFFGNTGSGGNDIFQIRAVTSCYGCLFSDSSVSSRGGAVLNNNCSPYFEKCEFRNGQATKGGAVYNEAASPLFSNCVFYKNYAGDGGVFYNTSGSQPKMLNCLASDNQVSGTGTVAYNDQSSLEVINSTFTRNLSLTNVSPYNPSVFFNKNNSSLTIRNSILWANQLGVGPFPQSYEISNSSGSVANLYNTLTQFYGTSGTNNNLVGIRPRLVDYHDADGPDDKFFTSDDGVRLSACSPLINAGLTAYANNIATDLAGNGRIFGASVDIGAYEFQNQVNNTSVFYVNPLASGTNDGTSWTNAYTSLHMALANTCADTIKIAKGVYYTSAASVDSSFCVRNGSAILGGYPNTGNPVDSLRDPVMNPVVLTGNIGNLADSSDNANHVISLVYVDGSSVLDGLTIQDGFSRVQSGDASQQSGGGIQVIGSDVQINNCIVRKNFASGDGGGLFISSSSKFKVKKSVFENNKAAFSGGGISFSSTGTILNSVFSDNQASNTGGGMFSAATNVTVANCVFYKNRADFGGGGAYNNGASGLNYTNCSFVSNAAVFRYGGGVYVLQNSDNDKPQFYNCVLYGNTFSGQNLVYADAYLTRCDYTGSCNYDIFFNSALQKIGNTPNQVFNQPNFVDINNGIGNDNQWMTKDDGLMLIHCSALINRGSNAFVSGISTDITNQSRVQDSIVDVGAYEYTFSLHGTTIANNAGDSLIANKEIADTAGWTHYFHDCAYLFSIHKDGRDIGSIADGSLKIGVVVGPAYASSQAVNLSGARFNTGGGALYAFNKYWFAHTDRSLSDSLLVRFPYAQTDFNDLKGSLQTLSDPSQLQFYTAPNLSYPFSDTIAANAIVQYHNGLLPSTSTWTNRQMDNFYISEFYVKALGSGTGFSTSVGPLPDLTFENLTLSASSVATANVLTVNLNEKNIGAATAGYHRASCYLSADSLLSPSDVLLGDVDVNQYLQPIQSVQLQKQLTVPCATVPGNYYVLAVADRDNHIAESNEHNNTFSRALQVLQGPSPLTSVSIVSNRRSDTLCSPDSAVLTISAPGCIGCQYLWIPGGDTTQSITVRNSGFLTVHVSNACGSVNVSKNILFQSGPGIVPTAVPSSICLGNSLTLYDMAGGLGADSIFWTGPNLSVISKDPIVVTPTAAGNLSYTEIAYNRTSVCSTGKTIVVAVRDTAHPTVQIGLNGCADPAVFRVSATTAAGLHPTFKWYLNDTLLNQGDTVLSLSNLRYGSRIYVVMTADNQCNNFDTAWSNQMVYSCFPTAVVDVQGVQELRLGPNPSNGQLCIIMKLEKPRRISAAIFNATGKEIFTLPESLWSGAVTKWFNFQSQPSGLYVLKLLIEGKTYSFKLLIAR